MTAVAEFRIPSPWVPGSPLRGAPERPSKLFLVPERAAEPAARGGIGIGPAPVSRIGPIIAPPGSRRRVARRPGSGLRFLHLAVAGRVRPRHHDRGAARALLLDQREQF